MDKQEDIVKKKTNQKKNPQNEIYAFVSKAAALVHPREWQNKRGNTFSREFSCNSSAKKLLPSLCLNTTNHWSTP